MRARLLRAVVLLWWALSPVHARADVLADVGASGGIAYVAQNGACGEGSCVSPGDYRLIGVDLGVGAWVSARGAVIARVRAVGFPIVVAATIGYRHRLGPLYVEVGPGYAAHAATADKRANASGFALQGRIGFDGPISVALTTTPIILAMDDPNDLRIYELTLTVGYQFDARSAPRATTRP